MENNHKPQTTNQEPDTIPNRVANSGLITLSLEDYYPKGLRLELDIAPWLYEGLILREKDFRESVKKHDWSAYQNAYVNIVCTADAIIPQWAYLLLGVSLQGIAKKVIYGTTEELENTLMENSLHQIDFSVYNDQRVILKGCSDLPIPPNAYLQAATLLSPHVKSLMFGEACSTVPVYKKQK